MAVQAQKKLFTVEEHYKMAEVGILSKEEHFELIHGEILKMSPINSPYAKIVARLTRMLNILLGETALVRSRSPIHIDDFSEPEPDLAVVEFQIDEYEDQHPLPQEVFLLIEVADSTLNRDRKNKLPLYASVNIPEVWILDLQKRVVEVYTQPHNGHYQKMEKLGEVEKLSCTSISLTLEVERVFARNFS